MDNSCPAERGTGAPRARRATKQTQAERRASTRLNTTNAFADALRKQWQGQRQQEEQQKPFPLSLGHWAPLKNVHPKSLT